jgi:hypothetical protein
MLFALGNVGGAPAVAGGTGMRASATQRVAAPGPEFAARSVLGDSIASPLPHSRAISSTFLTGVLQTFPKRVYSYVRAMYRPSLVEGLRDPIAAQMDRLSRCPAR